jgi:hypothetical protein
LRLVDVNVDDLTDDDLAAVGGYPVHLRLPLPEDMRVAYLLGKGSKHPYRRNGIRP